MKAHVDWFKARDILESPIVHAASRRADGRDLDWVLHANPILDEPALMVIHNPTDVAIARRVMADLYYSGLTGRAAVEYGSSAELPAARSLGEVELDGRERAFGGQCPRGHGVAQLPSPVRRRGPASPPRSIIPRRSRRGHGAPPGEQHQRRGDEGCTQAEGTGATVPGPRRRLRSEARCRRPRRSVRHVLP